MSKSYSDGHNVNPSANPHITEIASARLSRRDFLISAAALPILSVVPLAGCVSTPDDTAASPLRSAARATPGFASIDISTEDMVRVPPGYTATTFYKWGDPIGHASGAPSFKPDGSNTAEEQALQAGMHHDGIHYFALPYGSRSSTRGLLAMNHEYTDDGLLHSDGFANWSAAKVRKAQNARTMSSATSSGGWRRAAIPRASRSRGTSLRSRATRSTRRPTSTAISKARRSAARTASGSMIAVSSGSRPTARRARSIAATTRGSATIRCSVPIRGRARCAAFSPVRAAPR